MLLVQWLRGRYRKMYKQPILSSVKLIWETYGVAVLLVYQQLTEVIWDTLNALRNSLEDSRNLALANWIRFRLLTGFAYHVNTSIPWPTFFGLDSGLVPIGGGFKCLYWPSALPPRSVSVSELMPNLGPFLHVLPLHPLHPSFGPFVYYFFAIPLCPNPWPQVDARLDICTRTSWGSGKPSPTTLPEVSLVDRIKLGCGPCNSCFSCMPWVQIFCAFEMLQNMSIDVELNKSYLV